MYSSLDELMNNKVFKYFKEINNIPRGSANEKAVSDYILNFAKQRDLEVVQDEFLNIIIKKKATLGYESYATVILQGHMDMVCEKYNDVEHDFKKDPIKLKLKGDMLYAEGTTLGADNGIAVAYILAILDSDNISHPNLEILLTTEEESTMAGASNIHENLFDGKILINLDSEEEGKLLVSSAGGIDIAQNIPLKLEEINEKLVALDISVQGLKGGHSGLDIHKGRGNAIKIIGRVLKDLSYNIDYSLAFIEGGSRVNNIPSNANAKILIKDDLISELEERICNWNIELKDELYLKDDDIYISVKKSREVINKVFSRESSNNILNSIILLPNGVETMSSNIKDLVDSSINLGVITMKEDKVVLESDIRNSKKILKNSILEKIKIISSITNSELIYNSEFEEWAYNENSKILSLCKDVFKELYCKTPEVIAYHCGIECGIIARKIENLDCISIGPDIFDIHTPKEHLSISSTERTWKYILEILKRVKDY